MYRQPNACPYTLAQLRDAVMSHTPCDIQRAKDEDGDTVFLLLDGCGDAMGDPFPDLTELYCYVTGNQDVFDHLAQYN